MKITYVALNPQHQPIRSCHGTLESALQRAAQHLECGWTPMRLIVKRQRYDCEGIAWLLDERRPKRTTP